MNISLQTIIKNLNKNNTQILGLGYFTNGNGNYWKFSGTFIKELMNSHGALDVFLNEPYPLTHKLNAVINNREDLILNGDYDHADSHPLKEYLNSVGNDHQEFVVFLKVLNDLGNSGKTINLFGVGSLVKKSDYNLVSDKYEQPEYVHKLYPNLQVDDNGLHDEMKKGNYGIDDPDMYMQLMINYFRTDGRMGIIIANDTKIQKVKVGNYETLGYKLDQQLGNKYACLGTTGNEGKLLFAGRLKSDYQIRKTKVEPDMELFEKPKVFDFKDSGSFQRYIKRRKLDKDGDVLLKVERDLNVHYYRSNELKSDQDDKENFSNVDDLDYVMYFKDVEPCHLLIVKEDEEPVPDPAIFKSDRI